MRHQVFLCEQRFQSTRPLTFIKMLQQKMGNEVFGKGKISNYLCCPRARRLPFRTSNDWTWDRNGNAKGIQITNYLLVQGLPAMYLPVMTKEYKRP